MDIPIKNFMIWYEVSRILMDGFDEIKSVYITVFSSDNTTFETTAITVIWDRPLKENTCLDCHH